MIQTQKYKGDVEIRGNEEIRNQSLFFISLSPPIPTSPFSEKTTT
jgi:hypothetical protein